MNSKNMGLRLTELNLCVLVVNGTSVNYKKMELMLTDGANVTYEKLGPK